MENFSLINERQYNVPLVSIRESDKDILLSAEMPGLKKENIELEVDGDELTITGKIADRMPLEGYNVSYSERGNKDFYRKFRLNIDIEKDKIDAQYIDGVLKIAIPKSEEAKPKRITIK